MPRALARFRPLLGSLVLAAACGPFVILEETGSDDEGTETNEGTEDGPPSTTTSTTSSSTTAPTTSATTSTTSTTGDPTVDVPGVCALVCTVVEDCAQGGNPSDFACTNGFCEYTGVIPRCDPATCDDLLIGYCTELDGVSTCAMACSDDSMCIQGFTECTGQDDAGNPICAPIPCFGMAEGEPCEIDGFGQLGVCTNGECSCTEDSECTAEGFGCNG
jgi:hypothetical protein